MRKVIIAILAIFVAANSYAAIGYATVQGMLTGLSDETAEVAIFEVIDGVNHSVATCRLGNEKCFGFNLPLDVSKLYVIGSADQRYKGKWSFPLYLKKDDNTTIRINNDNCTYELIEACDENLALLKWEQYIWELKYPAIYSVKKFDAYEKLGTFPTYEHLFPILSNKIAGYQKNVTSFTINNKEFDDIFFKYTKYDLEFSAFSILNTGRVKHPEDNELIEFYLKFDYKSLLLNEEMLEYPNGLIFLYCVSATYKDRIDKSNAKGYLSRELFASDRMYGLYLSNFLGNVRSYSGLMNFENNYGKYMITQYLMGEMQKLSNVYANAKEGEAALGFNLPDRDGKFVDLKGLKGSVVLIDIWATWCSPCRAEIPYLKKLEEELKEYDDMKFVSISVDEKINHQKWLNMLDKDEMHGIQLIDYGGFKSRIIKDYKINGIPRFLVIDRDGTLIKLNAPAPSNIELKNILLKLLKK